MARKERPLKPPEKPPIPAEVWADLERRGVPAVTAILSHLSAYDSRGGVLGLCPEIETAYVLRRTSDGDESVTRAQVEKWLAWKAAVTDGEQRRRDSRVLWWTVAGVIAAALGCIAAVIAAWEGRATL